jgi:hypothetical protein
MNPISNRDISDFLLGSATDEIAQTIAERIATDVEFGAKLDVMRSLVGRGDHGDVVQPIAPKWKRSVVLWGKCAVALLLVCLLGGAAWWALSEPPLVTDDFNDNWFNSKIWRHPPQIAADVGLREELGVIKLINRGYLIPRGAFREPFALEFDWLWINHGLNPRNNDILTVALRTSAEHNPERPYEARDGLLVAINVWAGNVTIRAAENTDLELAASPEEVIPFPAGEWKRVRVTDDGKWIRVYLSKRGLTIKPDEEPVLEYEHSNTAGKHGIAIYNREIFKSTLHESLIDNLQIEKLDLK